MSLNGSVSISYSDVRAPNIYCAGAGTAADCDKTTATIASQLELHKLNTGRQVRVVAAQRMVKQMLFR